MRRTRGLLMFVLGMFLFCTAKNEVLASDLQREYYQVISGTATKLGTEESEEVSKGTYLEEWMVPDGCVLGEDVAKVLLESSNANQLPQINELNAEVLKALAKEATGKKLNIADDIYQGYARLKLQEAAAGYTYGIVIEEENETGNYVVTGYYAELEQKAIYKVKLICEKSSYSQIFKTVKIVDASSVPNNSKPEPEEILIGSKSLPPIPIFPFPGPDRSIPNPPIEGEPIQKYPIDKYEKIGG